MSVAPTRGPARAGPRGVLPSTMMRAAPSSRRPAPRTGRPRRHRRRPPSARADARADRGVVAGANVRERKQRRQPLVGDVRCRDGDQGAVGVRNADVLGLAPVSVLTLTEEAAVDAGGVEAGLAVAQVPSLHAKGAMTKSPTARSRDLAPTSSTTPMNSWPTDPGRSEIPR